MSKSPGWSVRVGLALLTAGLSAHAGSGMPKGYHVQCQDCDLPPAAYYYNLVLSINNRGVVAGQVDDARAVLYDHGARIDLGTLGGSTGIAWDVNDANIAVGQASLPDGSAHAFSWRDGVMADLGVLRPGDVGSIASSINRHGQVVGTSTTPGGRLDPAITHCFLLSLAHPRVPMEDLGLPLEAPPNAQCDEPTINAHGHVAVTIGDETWSSQHAYLLHGGSWTNLGELDPAIPNSFAQGINDKDQVVGWSGSTAFIWSNGTMQGLGFLSGDGTGGAGAYGINNKGHVVGVSSIAGTVKQNVHYSTAAFLYQDQRMVDLNSMLDLGSQDWYIERAIDINDSEVIAAIGYLRGVAHAVLLTPRRCDAVVAASGAC